VKRIVRDTGAYDYSVDLAKRFQQMAVRYLDESHLSLRGREFLHEMAQYIIAREY
jgi:geranylgeranyl pyrophosphate synthase